MFILIIKKNSAELTNLVSIKLKHTRFIFRLNLASIGKSDADILIEYNCDNLEKNKEKERLIIHIVITE